MVYLYRYFFINFFNVNKIILYIKTGGFADLRHPDNWTMDHVRVETTRVIYENMVDRMLDALHFTSTIG